MSKYHVGQTVCLWNAIYDSKRKNFRVIREVLVVITDVKTGVRIDDSDRVTSHQSLKGVDENGKVYEKHWNLWPERGKQDFSTRWSRVFERDDSVWVPVESIHAYNNISHGKERGTNISLVDNRGVQVKPKGDNIVFCWMHNRYWYGTKSNEACQQCVDRQFNMLIGLEKAFHPNKTQGL
jgi:hypothetical protein